MDSKWSSLEQMLNRKGVERASPAMTGSGAETSGEPLWDRRPRSSRGFPGTTHTPWRDLGVALEDSRARSGKGRGDWREEDSLFSSFTSGTPEPVLTLNEPVSG